MTVFNDLPDLAAAIVAESHRTPEAALDLLLEMKATLCDVLLLYAGTPPEWSDGLAQDVLAEWLKRTGDVDRAAKVGKSHILPLQVVAISSFAVHVPAEILDTVETTVWPTESDARRYLKRSILSLFPEVEYTREVFLPDSLIVGMDRNGNVVLKGEERGSLIYRYHWLELKGIRSGFHRDEARGLIGGEDGSCITQTLAAPDWIPPR